MEFCPFPPRYSRGAPVKQVVPAPQAKLRFFWGNRKDSLCGQARWPIFLGGTGNPEGPAWRESRGAPCRQGAGDVASLPCPRETAAEKEVSEPAPHGDRRSVRHGAKNAGAVV